MTIENELTLSYYKEISELNQKHHVKLVQHVETNRIFVLKTMQVYDLSIYQMLKENKLPGIPKIQELIEDNHTLYVIEEYISGNTLSEEMEEHGVYSEYDASQIIQQLCRILIPLHSNQPPIVHRDLKPENIIRNENSELYIIDFNAAKITEYSSQPDTVLFGTNGYAAPEQYGFSESTPATDVYALGVLFNELLTGKLPSDHLTDGPNREMIRKSTQMDVNNRYKNAFQLFQAFYKTEPKEKTQPFVQEKSIPYFHMSQKVVSSYLPVGFRSKNPLYMMIGFIGYIFICYVTFTYVPVPTPSPASLLANRIIFFVLLIGLTLLCGNYQNIWDKLPVLKVHHWISQLFGLFLWITLYTFAMAMVAVLFTSLL